MKTIPLLTIKKLVYPLWPILCFLTLGLIGLHHPLAGQSKPTPAQSLVPTQVDSAQGYWRLKTDAPSRSTRVEFFGPHHQLLYQEQLAEKWVKLTRRNQAQFDRLLGQLVANQLLASRIRIKPLPASIAQPRLPPAIELSEGTPNASSSSETVHAYVNQAGQVRVIVENPQRQRYVVELLDKEGWRLYQEYTNHPRYSRWLDVSELAVDSCRLVVQFKSSRTEYELSHRRAQQRYQLQPLVISQR